MGGQKKSSNFFSIIGRLFAPICHPSSCLHVYRAGIVLNVSDRAAST